MSGDLAFPQLFETVPDALVVVDGNGTIVAANGHAERLFGYAPGTLPGLAVEVLVPEDARGRHRGHRTGYMHRPRVRPMGDSGQALVGLRRDGTQFPVEIALTPLEDPAGTRFLASVRDVSETQRARQALVRARYDAVVARIGQLALEARDDAAVLADVPALLADALDIGAVAVAFQRADGAGLDVRAAHGMGRALLEALSDGETAAGFDWAMLAGGRPLVLHDVAEGGPFLVALPTPGPGSAAAVPLLDRGRVMGVLLALADRPRRFDHDALHLLGSVANMLAAMMQRRHTEEQLAHSQRLDAIGQLTGGIAHDFNNLLTIISGNLQLIEDDATPATAELAAGALRSVARGADLTAKLLAFARRQRLSPKAVDAATVLRDVEAMLRRTLGESIQIRVRTAPDLPPAYADATQLDTALVNLALNARDAMPRGGELTLSADVVVLDAADDRDAPPPGAYVRFVVQDTGRGMAPETLARALEPFFTTKEVGRGSGLGLSMVYGFARQSGGRLRLESRLGYGTRVELLLPVARAAAPAGTTAPAAMRRGRGEHVLVVEDEPDVRAVAVAFLQSLGYRTEAVASADDALRVLRGDDRVDLLFSDVMLGDGLNGHDLALAARAVRPALPVLLTSGYNEQAGAGDGGFELLRKPYRREQLAEAIARGLAGRA